MVLQKVVNFVTIVIAVALLFSLNTRLTALSENEKTILKFTDLIARGGQLNEQQHNAIHQLLTEQGQDNEKKNGLCFLKAYQEIALKQAISAVDLFQIFAQDGAEYDNVRTCSNYYTLLIYRAQTSQHQSKSTILATLNQLLQIQLTKRYKLSDSQNQICLFFYAHSTESTIKKQIQKILEQKYQKFNASVYIDGSKDNTHMFAKYTIESETGTKKDKINIKFDTQTKGYLNQLSSFVENSCYDNSIVILLQKSESFIGQYSFHLISTIFSDENIKVAVFSTLTTDHSNFQSIRISQRKQTVSSYPFVAFRRQSFSKVKDLISRLTAGQNIDRYQGQLFKHAISTPNEIFAQDQILYLNEAVITSASRNAKQQAVFNQQSSNFYDH